MRSESAAVLAVAIVATIALFVMLAPSNAGLTGYVVVEEGADLVISNHQTPRNTYSVGEEVSLYFVLVNIGEESSLVKYAVDDAGASSGDYETFATQGIPSCADTLQIGSAQGCHVKRNLRYTTPGTKTITITADYYDEVDEENENNNVATVQFTITGTPGSTGGNNNPDGNENPEPNGGSDNSETGNEPDGETPEVNTCVATGSSGAGNCCNAAAVKVNGVCSVPPPPPPVCNGVDKSPNDQNYAGCCEGLTPAYAPDLGSLLCKPACADGQYRQADGSCGATPPACVQGSESGTYYRNWAETCCTGSESFNGQFCFSACPTGQTRAMPGARCTVPYTLDDSDKTPFEQRTREICPALSGWLDSRYDNKFVTLDVERLAPPLPVCSTNGPTPCCVPGQGIACGQSQVDSFWSSKWQSFQNGASDEEACRWRAAVETELITNDRDGFDTFFFHNSGGLGAAPTPYQSFYNEWRLAWYGPLMCNRGSVYNDATNKCEWTLQIDAPSTLNVQRGQPLQVVVTTQEDAFCDIILPDYYEGIGIGNWWTYIDNRLTGVARSFAQTGQKDHTTTVSAQYLATRTLSSLGVACKEAAGTTLYGGGANEENAAKNGVIIPLTFDGDVSENNCDITTRGQQITLTDGVPSLQPTAGYKVAAGWDGKYFCCGYGETAGANGCNGVPSVQGTPLPLCDKGLEGKSCNINGADFGYSCTGGLGSDAKCCPTGQYWVAQPTAADPYGGSCQVNGCIGAGVLPQPNQVCCDGTSRTQETNGDRDVCWYTCGGPYEYLATQLGVPCAPPSGSGSLNDNCIAAGSAATGTCCLGLERDANNVCAAPSRNVGEY